MERIFNITNVLGGAICAALTFIFGGLDALLLVLLGIIAIDYISGILAAIYNKNLSSEIGYKGIIKKVCILLIVAVAHMVQHVVPAGDIRGFVIGFFIANEALSILENIGNTGGAHAGEAAGCIKAAEKFKSKRVGIVSL